MFHNRYRIGFILLIAVYSYGNTIFSEVYHYYGIEAPWYGLIGLFALLTAMIWEGDRWIERGVGTHQPGKDTLRSLVIFFILSMLYSALLSLGVVFIAGRWIYPVSPGRATIVLKLGVTLGTRINLFLQVVNVIFFFSKRYRDKLLEAEEARRAGALAQLQAIRNQVNPHFLFNNLNVLASLVIRDNPEANKFIEEFAIVYRHVLNSEQKELVPVREELEFIRHYIFLINTRFPDSIIFDIRVSPDYEECYVVPVALQMLVENAIKHNIASKAHPLTIQIFIDEGGNLVVSNNLQPMPVKEESTLIGLKNISRRYDLVGEKNIMIQQDNDHFSVTLPLISPER